MSLQNNPENYLKNFLKYLSSEKYYSSNTVNNYQLDLKNFFNFCKKNTYTLDKQENIQNYIFKLKRSLYTAKTISRHLSAIKSFFKYLIKIKVKSSNPCFDLHIPKLEKRLPDIFTHQETEKLFNNNCCKGELNIRDLAMFDLIYSCGLRVSECASIKNQDISLNDKKISITGKGNKQRIVFFGSKTKGNLKKWLKIRKNKYNNLIIDNVFVSKHKKPISVRTIQNRLKIFCQNNGINKNVYPHMLRHSFATDMLQGSKNLRSVQELLGHKNISTTQIYTHLDFDYLFNEYSQFHPRAQKKK